MYLCLLVATSNESLDVKTTCVIIIIPLINILHFFQTGSTGFDRSICSETAHHAAVAAGESILETKTDEVELPASRSQIH